MNPCVLVATPLRVACLTTQVSWWDALDFIGVDAYFPLANASDAAPPVDQLVAGASALSLSVIRGWTCPACLALQRGSPF